MEERKKVQERVEKVFKENNLTYDWDVDLTLTYVVTINVQWGDWKHDHICLRRIMEQNGFIFFGEEVTEEDGSDTYSATHTYIFKG